MMSNAAWCLDEALNIIIAAGILLAAFGGA